MPTVNKLGLAADTGSKQESGWVDSVLGQLARVVAGPSFDTVNRLDISDSLIHQKT